MSAMSLAADQLARVESLGLNCEVGSVLRHFGDETPSLFRWAWAPPTAILKLLDADFADLYAPERMTAGGHNVVKDQRYGILFHSNIETVDPDGDWRFRFVDADERKRHRILKAEQTVIAALAERFRERMVTPDTLFVLTRHAREPAGSAGEIVERLAARAGKVPFALLEVRPTEDPSSIAPVEQVGDHLYRGEVLRFAPYEAAHDVDVPSWTRLLDETLSLTRPKSFWRSLRGRRPRQHVGV